VLLVGVSTRAMAESAVRAGYDVLSVDGYGDLDNPATPALSLSRDLGVEYSARAAADAAADLDYDALCYCSNLENHPLEVERLSRRGELWGNPPAVLRRARDPLLVSRILSGRLHASPAVRVSAPPPIRPSDSVRAGAPLARAGGASDVASESVGSLAREREWLAKPRASGGGQGISEWRVGDPLPRSHILQERIAGTPGSLAFVADGRTVLPFAISRQLVGDRAFGTSGFRYCGSILAACPRSVIDAATESALLLTEQLGLVGVNCIDFVVRDGVPYVIELNPRHSASMELAERAFGFSVFAAHAAVFERRRSGAPGPRTESTPTAGGAVDCAVGGGEFASAFPRLDLAASLDRVGAFGKAILFAPYDITMSDTRPWLADAGVRDVPHPGETISRGQPMFTIFATGSDYDECYSALVHRAREAYERIGDEERAIG
jgi:predicted ATP-grasp superfamily ATP-dependent carboligase